MSDDTDLLLAAAATAAVVTWVGTRRRARDWRVLLHAIGDGIARCWRDTPAYHFGKAIREAFFRRR